MQVCSVFCLRNSCTLRFREDYEAVAFFRSLQLQWLAYSNSYTLYILAERIFTRDTFFYGLIPSLCLPSLWERTKYEVLVMLLRMWCEHGNNHSSTLIHSLIHTSTHQMWFSNSTYGLSTMRASTACIGNMSLSRLLSRFLRRILLRPIWLCWTKKVSQTTSKGAIFVCVWWLEIQLWK